ncbi:MAG: DUF4368 domain-containing protein [Oscillospiraceae bacterium]|nr:DUF4368 domain-containing protein [Oscillospiraceae bacterium]
MFIKSVMNTRAAKKTVFDKKTVLFLTFRAKSFEQVLLRGELGVNRIDFIRGYISQFKEKQRVIDLVLRYEAHFRAIMEEKMQTESKAILKAKRKQLEKAEKRIQELDRLFVRTYEDNVAGKLSDERFAAMSRGYEEEQQGLKEAAEVLRKEIQVQEQQNQNLDLFIERIQKFTALEELTPYVAHELIKAIYVGAPDKSSGKRRQSVHIEYDLIGFIPLDELMKQETA